LRRAQNNTQGAAVGEARVPILLQAEPTPIALIGVSERLYQNGEVLVPGEQLYTPPAALFYKPVVTLRPG
jgi:hypothetical protein